MKLNKMVFDDKKIEAAANKHIETEYARYNSGEVEEEMICLRGKDSFKAGAKWAINEFAENTRMIRAKLPDGYCDLVRTDVWNGRVNHPEEHDIVKYTAISWYREEFVGGVDLGRNYMHAKYKFFELVVNKKYILEMKHKKNENAR